MSVILLLGIDLSDIYIHNKMHVIFCKIVCNTEKLVTALICNNILLIR
jgi:hypothetical protein